jgi:hypothetical protein
MEFVEAPPGGKRKISYAYQVLQPIGEESGVPSSSVGPVGNAGGLRDTATPQLVSATAMTIFAGRKRSATSAAAGSGRRAPGHRHLASAADFSPTHFSEPVSDGPIPPPQSSHRREPSSPHPPTNLPSPMDVDRRFATPISSPIYQNPLLQRGAPVAAQTPSPLRRAPPILRTQDSNAVWAAAEGLRPIQEGFTAPGYMPARLVGGITYTVRSPHPRSPQVNPPTTQRMSVARQLFADYASTGMQGNNLQQQSAAQDIGLQQQTASQRPQFQQQQTVFCAVHWHFHFTRIY